MTTEATASSDLVAALGALDDLKRDRTAKVETKGGGSYSYAYTDLAGVLGAVRPVLAAHGFAVVQPVASEERGTVLVWTELVHRTGERFPSPALAMRQPDGAQALGSLLTYLRRYSLLAALGLATEDDDGKAASSTPPPARQTTTRRRTPATDEAAYRRRTAMALFGDLGYRPEDREERLEYTSAIVGRSLGSWNDATPDEQIQVIVALQERKVEEEHADDLARHWDETAAGEERDHAGY